MKTGYTPAFPLFPLAHQYARFTVTPSTLACEQGVRERNDPPSERHLRCVWADAAFRPANLFTVEGEPVRVEDPGRWNLEAGPDFLDAILRIGHEARRVVGDIEVHMRPSDWQHHGHSADPAYRKVICHLTYWPGRLPDGALPPGATHIALRNALAAIPTFSFESIDVDSFPYAALTSERPPCADILATFTNEERINLLEAAGQERIRLKSTRLAAAIGEVGADQALYEEWMGALGFKQNRLPFRTLARTVTAQELREASEGDPITAYAILLGVAGLIPRQSAPNQDQDAVDFIRRLWTIWWKRESRFEKRLMSRNLWRLSGCRPLNHPVRRLAAAADLFARTPPLPDRLLSIPLGDPAAWQQGFHELLEPTEAMRFMRYRQSIAGSPRPSPVAFIGSEREAAIVSNVVIPFLAACGKTVEPLFESLASEADSSTIRETAHALFGRDHAPSLYSTGLRQQGLIQIAHDFCLDRRAGCAGCRLPRELAATRS